MAPMGERLTLVRALRPVPHSEEVSDGREDSLLLEGERQAADLVKGLPCHRLALLEDGLLVRWNLHEVDSIYVAIMLVRGEVPACAGVGDEETIFLTGSADDRAVGGLSGVLDVLSGEAPGTRVARWLAGLGVDVRAALHQELA